MAHPAAAAVSLSRASVVARATPPRPLRSAVARLRRQHDLRPASERLADAVVAVGRLAERQPAERVDRVDVFAGAALPVAAGVHAKPEAAAGILRREAGIDSPLRMQNRLVVKEIQQPEVVGPPHGLRKQPRLPLIIPRVLQERADVEHLIADVIGMVPPLPRFEPADEAPGAAKHRRVAADVAARAMLASQRRRVPRSPSREGGNVGGGMALGNVSVIRP